MSIFAGSVRRLGLVFVRGLFNPTATVGAEEVAANVGSGRTVEWTPAADFYPQYIADPLRTQSALKILYMADSEIGETSSSRFGLHLGGRFGLVRGLSGYEFCKRLQPKLSGSVG